MFFSGRGKRGSGDWWLANMGSLSFSEVRAHNMGALPPYARRCLGAFSAVVVVVHVLFLTLPPPHFASFTFGAPRTLHVPQVLSLWRASSASASGAMLVLMLDSCFSGEWVAAAQAKGVADVVVQAAGWAGQEKFGLTER